MDATPAESELKRPTIIESYRTFEPPPNFKQCIETLLRYVPDKYLVGLKTIVLTNRAGLTGKKRKQKVWSRNRKVQLATALGSYSRASRTTSAEVWLYVDNIVAEGFAGLYRLPVLRYLVVSDVLYHEIGHHIHTAHLRVYEGRENIAEDWSRKLRGTFYRRHYWYLFPFLLVFAKLTSPIFKRLKRRA